MTYDQHIYNINNRSACVSLKRNNNPHSDIKPVIFGFPKCGTQSYRMYLSDKYNMAVATIEKVWYGKDALNELVVRKFLDHGFKPHFITRDPVQFIWTAFNFWPTAKDKTLLEFLYSRNLQKRDNPLGLLIGEMTKWDDFIKIYADYNPIVVKFEDMVKLPRFPHINKTRNKKPLDEKSYKTIKEYLSTF